MRSFYLYPLLVILLTILVAGAFFFRQDNSTECLSELKNITCDKQLLRKYFEEFFKKNKNIYVLNGFQARTVSIKDIKKIKVTVKKNLGKNRIALGQNGGFNFSTLEKNKEILILIELDDKLLNYLNTESKNRELNSLLTAVFYSLAEEKNVLNLANLPLQQEAMVTYNEIMKESFVLKIK